MAASIQAPQRRGRTRKGRRAGLVAEINVTPFVDVMLVLLIVFMITAPLMTTGVPVNLPTSDSPALPGQDEPLSVTVTAAGEVFIQDTQTPMNELQAKLEAISASRRDMRIFVRGDLDVDYGTIMAAVSAIKASGLSNIALVTDASTALQ